MKIILLSIFLIAPVTLSQAETAKVWALDWDQLLPEKDRASFEPGPPMPAHGYLGESARAVRQVMHFDTNPQLDNRTIRIAGFIAPLTIDPTGKIKDFYLVPYFGACIHVPPPPPNQLIYVKLATPVRVESTYDAYWVTGKVSIQKVTTMYGSTAYSMEGAELQVYEYPK